MKLSGLPQEISRGLVNYVAGEGGLLHASHNPEGSQRVPKARVFQNGRTTHASQPRGLDDKIRSEGCLPIHADHQHLLMKIQNLSVPLIWADICPHVFFKIVKPVVGALQHMGIHLVIYTLVLHQSMEDMTQLTPLICQLFKALGPVVNQKKSILTPHQTVEFLGTVNIQPNSN